MKNITRTWPVLRTVPALCKRLDELAQIPEIELTEAQEAEIEEHELMLGVLHDNPQHYV